VIIVLTPEEKGQEAKPVKAYGSLPCLFTKKDKEVM